MVTKKLDNSQEIMKWIEVEIMRKFLLKWTKTHSEIWEQWILNKAKMKYQSKERKVSKETKPRIHSWKVSRLITRILWTQYTLRITITSRIWVSVSWEIKVR
jgi:hypothetical protein